MGKVTPSELSESLNDLIDEKLNTEEYSLMTESKTIVGAINEIYGKEIIANAIGEPLDRSDTFAEMGNDINSLLSTFKTNMMNSGITVESGDKFKQLIDKIKGLTEGEGNKGIRFAEGGPITISNGVVIEHNCGFVPTYFFARGAIITIKISTATGTGYSHKDYPIQNMLLSNLGITGYSTNLDYTSSRSGGAMINNLTDTTATVVGTASGSITWYAIGVGEEDTTLRDSLASILQDEGVIVTEEDNMASLITKVDEEFDRKNVEIRNLNKLSSDQGFLVELYKKADNIDFWSHEWTNTQYSFISPVNGPVTISTSFKIRNTEGSEGTVGFIRYKVVKADGTVIYTDEGSGMDKMYSTVVTKTVNVNNGDNIIVEGKTTNSGLMLIESVVMTIRINNN